jgi:hypothetical protein
MKLSKLLDTRFSQAFNKLLPEVLPIKTAFHLKKIMKIVNEAIDNYEELRQIALQKYAKKDSEGNILFDPETGAAEFDDASIQLFVKEIEDLMSVEIDIPKIKPEDFGGSLSLSVEDLTAIEDIIEY